MKRIIAGITILTLALSACSNSNANQSVANDQAQTNSQLDRYQKNQPIPAYDFSQYRQTVIDVEYAEVHGVATTTFFFNQGVKDPTFSCPSLGFPVAVTAQLTNPTQVTWINHDGSRDSGVVEQQEPNGVYTGASSGTYVTCVAPNGAHFYKYWEGFVDTVGAPAHWDGGQEVIDGAPTVKVNTK